MKSRLLFLLLTLFTSTVLLEAQQTFQPRPLSLADNKGLLFDKEYTFDLRLQTNGFALAFNRGKIKTYYKTNFWQLELGELKSPKEFRNTWDFSRRESSSYIYGKRNNLYVVRFGLGQKRYFSEKASKKGLAVGATYSIGPALGIIKPYQLILIYYNDPTNPIDDVKRNETYSDQNSDIFTDISRIDGAAGFGKGWNGVTFRPGAQAKASLHLDWGAFDQVVKAFEVGVMLDVYPSKIPLLIPVEGNENRAYFLNLYLTLQFGKRS